MAELGLDSPADRTPPGGTCAGSTAPSCSIPTPWLRGGELLLTTGLQLDSAKTQRELVERLAEHKIGGLGFGTGFAHKRLPAALLAEARRRSLPAVRGPLRAAVHRDHRARLRAARWTSATKCCSARMAGDVLADALTGRLYPEELQSAAAPVRDRRAGGGAGVRRARPRGGGAVGRADALAREPIAGKPGRDPRAACSARWSSAGGELDPTGAGAPRPRASSRRGSAGGARERQPRGPDALAAAELPRGALRAGGGAPAERQRPADGRRLPRGPRRLPAAALAAGRRRAAVLLPRGAAARSKRARASTATSCCARSTCSSSTTATGRRPPARSTATATRCATASARGAADRARLLQRSRPHRVLAGAARTGAGAMIIGVPTRDQARTSTASR